MVFGQGGFALKWKDKDDREIKINPMLYLVDWKRVVSGPQFAVKNFLYKYWKDNVVCEEFLIFTGKNKQKRYRYDLLNLTKKIIIEVSPDSTHLEFNKFMHGTKANYHKRITGDYEKMELAELNGFKFIELNDEHLENLTKKMFKETFNLTL